MISFGKYSKSITALVGAGIAWAYQVLESSSTKITGHEWVDGAVLLFTALGVYQVSNEEL